MKKILSVFVAIAMLLSLVAPFKAPTASAFPATNNITLTQSNFYYPRLTEKLSTANPDPAKDPDWTFNYFSFHPATNPANQLNNASLGAAGMKYEVYRMGETIYGSVTGLDLTQNWQAILAKYVSGTTYEVVDTLKQVAGINKFTLQTGNVDQDGEYLILIYYGFGYDPGDSINISTSVPYEKEVVYITYNFKILNYSFNTCSSYYSVTGYVTRGNGQTVLFPVRVWVTSPGDLDAAAYWVQPNSSGMFTITFPSDSPYDGDNLPDIGRFYFYILDSYDGYNAALGLGEPDTIDAIAYYYLSNVPTTTMTVSTYITPFIYKSTISQPLLLVVRDQNGDPVTGLLQADWTVTNATVGGYSEISPGFYRFELNVGAVVDVRFKVTKSFYGIPVYSNEIIIDTRTIDVFNPYIDITAPDAIAPYGEGPWELDSVQSVYDKLPCTVGNSFEIMVDSWPVKDPANWYVYDGSWSLEGPVEDLSGECGYGFGDTMAVLVTQAGKISVTIDMTAWERVNKDCPTWTQEITSTEKSQNACCHTYEKTIDICEVKSCTYGGVTLSGTNVTDSKTVEVGKKVDKLSISLDATGAPADLACGCPYGAALIYMVDKNGDLVTNAFTVDTWGNYTVKGSMIWYNPQYDSVHHMFDHPYIPDQPIQNYQATGIYSAAGALLDQGIKVEGGCPITIDGITFNYPTGTACGYTIVVKVFGWQRKYDACGNAVFTFPMIAESFNEIAVTPTTTTLSATATLTEGTVDPDKILAGVPVIIDITAPGFSFDKGDTTNWKPVSWKYYLNGTLLDFNSYCNTFVEYGLSITNSKTDTGYRFVLSRPFSSSGTFKIVGTSYYYNCTKKEVVTIEIEVVKPEFTVSIGLKDCDKTIIPSDGILTEGFDELVYVKAVDPRGVHDFSTDPNWNLSASAVKNACGLPSDKVCYVLEGPGCTYGLPIRVVGYDNPNLTDDPKVNIYFNSNGASIKVTSLKLVPPTITVDPKEVPFTTAPDDATTTHVTFTVTDAHSHHPSDISVTILNLGAFGVGGSGYSWSASAGTTGCNGEVDWGFVPPYSGKYVIKAIPNLALTCALPCGWPGINTTATLEAVYKAPVIDTTAPTVTVTAPTEVTTSTVKITGKATDNVRVVQVWVGAKQVTVAPDGTFEAVLDLAVGDNTFTVSAYDSANPPNVGTAKVTVKYVVPQVTKIVLKIGSDIMEVNGKAVQLDAAAEIKNGRTFLPLRAIAEAFGATVTWVPETQGITVVLGDTQIGLQIGNNTAVINGNVISIEPPYIKNSRTMVPFRVISEAFGADVQWDPINYIVTVTLQG